MGNMSPVLVDVAILTVGVVAYALIWFVSRDLSRIAQIMARVLPLVLFAPMFIVLQPHLAALKTAPVVPNKQLEKAARPEPPVPEAPQAPEPGKSPPLAAERHARRHSPCAKARRARRTRRGLGHRSDLLWNRSRSEDRRKRITYTSDRGRRLELGRALVTVPKAHQVPNIERPFAIRVPYFQVTVYETSEDPSSTSPSRRSARFPPMIS